VKAPRFIVPPPVDKPPRKRRPDKGGSGRYFRSEWGMSGAPGDDPVLDDFDEWEYGGPRLTVQTQET
jgi:hypothetical protein